MACTPLLHGRPATLGMVLGSFLAGSTPLGGGVVAFPIAVSISGIYLGVDFLLVVFYSSLVRYFHYFVLLVCFCGALI